MKVKCLANTGESLYQSTIDSGQWRTTIYDPIKIGEEYMVYGILMWRGTLRYLLSGPITDLVKSDGCNWRKKSVDKWPFWYPVELFKITDSSIPLEWSYVYKGGNDEYSRYAIWGYKELALNEDHNAALQEREPEALEIFFKRKTEIDKSDELRVFIPNIHPVKNRQCLIKKMMELQNINDSELLFYGLKKEIIDPEFCVEFAMSYLGTESKQKNLVLAEIAGLTKSEFDQVEPILSTVVKDSKDNEKAINKLWFYLVLASDISESGFID